MRLARESTRPRPRLRSQRFLTIITIITLQTTLTLSGLEAPLNSQRKRTLARLSSPRTFEATSTLHSGGGGGCSSRPLKNGLRNSRPATAAHPSSDTHHSARHLHILSIITYERLYVSCAYTRLQI